VSSEKARRSPARARDAEAGDRPGAPRNYKFLERRPTPNRNPGGKWLRFGKEDSAASSVATVDIVFEHPRPFHPWARRLFAAKRGGMIITWRPATVPGLQDRVRQPLPLDEPQDAERGCHFAELSRSMGKPTGLVCERRGSTRRCSKVVLTPDDTGEGGVPGAPQTFAGRQGSGCCCALAPEEGLGRHRTTRRGAQHIDQITLFRPGTRG